MTQNDSTLASTPSGEDLLLSPDINPRKPLVEMTDEELSQWHASLRRPLESPPTLAALLVAKPAKAKESQAAKEKKKFDEYV